MPPILFWTDRSTPNPFLENTRATLQARRPRAPGTTPRCFLHEPQVTLAEAIALPAKLRCKLAAWLRVSGQFDDAAELLDLIEQEAGESATLLDERAALALGSG